MSDKIDSGTFDKAKGRAKQALGDLTDDDSMKAEGKADEAAGTLKSGVDTAKDKANDAIDAVREKVDKA